MRRSIGLLLPVFSFAACSGSSDGPQPVNAAADAVSPSDPDGHGHGGWDAGRLPRSDGGGRPEADSGAHPTADSAPASDGASTTSDSGPTRPDASFEIGIPQNVQILLQGLDHPGESVSTTPPAGSHITLGWKSVPGATAYNIYRSTNQGKYALYASTVTAAAATATYDAYAKPSSPWTCTNVFTGDGIAHTIDCPVQTTVDSAYQDTHATDAVGNADVTVTGTTGKSGTDWNSGTGYTYKVSAIIEGTEGPLSNDSYVIYFADGVRVANEGEFNPTSWVLDDTSLATLSPLGFSTVAKLSATPSAGAINPYVGIGAVNQNLNLRGFNYFVINIYPAVGSATTFVLIPERSGDIGINNIDTSKYGSVVPGHWNTINIPLSDLMIDSSEGTYVQQHSLYKINFGSSAPSTGTFWMEWYFSKCGDSTGDATCTPTPLHTY